MIVEHITGGVRSTIQCCYLFQITSARPRGEEGGWTETSRSRRPIPTAKPKAPTRGNARTGSRSNMSSVPPVRPTIKEAGRTSFSPDRGIIKSPAGVKIRCRPVGVLYLF
ncbi:hypothetical protein OF83DRAFT_1144503, partial [Amylostereum chailletii]